MRKSKTLSALVLTLGLLVLGALLPELVGAIQTKTSMKTGVGELQWVDLKLKRSMGMIEKLCLMADGRYYPVTENMSLTDKALIEALEEALGPYYYRDLIPYNWKNVKREVTAQILYRQDAPEVNYPVWIVTMHTEDWEVSLHLDDETGGILNIMYITGEPQWQMDIQDVAENLKNAWFESLGLYDTHWTTSKITDQTGNTSGVRCDYYHETYGSLSAEFVVHPNGFWIQFLE